MIIYEMVTGQNPYPSTDKPIILHEMMRDKPAPNFDHIPSVSDALKDFIKRCLQKEPSQRQTAGDLLNH